MSILRVGWVFTVNQEPEAFRDQLADLYETHKAAIRYICGQLERGTETGHLHFQGYVQFKRTQRLSFFKRTVSRTAHAEPQRGTNPQARDYCKKEDDTTVEDTFVEFGDFVEGRGARTDLLALREAVIEQKTQRAIIEDDSLVVTFARHLKFHDRVRLLYPPSPKENREVMLYYGAPGLGKTRKVREDFGDDLYVVPISNGVIWFDGYDGQETVLIDDFMGRGSKFALSSLLRLLDRYVERVPVKGGFVWFNPTRIILTTNYHPRAWYNYLNREDSFTALERRFTKVVWFESRDEDPEEFGSVAFFRNVDLWGNVPENE